MLQNLYTKFDAFCGQLDVYKVRIVIILFMEYFVFMNLFMACKILLRNFGNDSFHLKKKLRKAVQKFFWKNYYSMHRLMDSKVKLNLKEY